LEVFLTDTS